MVFNGDRNLLSFMFLVLLRLLLLLLSLLSLLSFRTGRTQSFVGIWEGDVEGKTRGVRESVSCQGCKIAEVVVVSHR